MSIKRENPKAFNYQINYNEPINIYNIYPNEFLNVYDLMNIIYDSDSEEISNNEVKRKFNQLKNENENYTIYKEDSNFEYNKINLQKELPMKKPKDIEIQITNEDQISYKQNGDQLPPQYLYDKIKSDIFPKMHLKDEIKENFILNENLLKLEKSMNEITFLSKKKRKRELYKSKVEIKKKRGRKKINESSVGLHNKESEDNIIKKIKSKSMDYLLTFTNESLKLLLKKDRIKFCVYKGKTVNNSESEKIIKNIDYNIFVNDMKKENNLKFLKMKIKDLLSNNISAKYKNLQKDLNKIKIEELLEKEKNNEILNFLFNLSFGDWLDVFIYKKEFLDFGIKDNKIIKEISDNFERVDKLLEEIYSSNIGNNYFSFFISLLYNYKRWFFIKQGRERKGKNNKNEGEK